MTSAPPPPTPPAPPPLDPPTWAPPPPPPPGPPARPQLRRSRTDKILGGVSGGLAEYSGIDALLWRVGFVALTLAGGTGIVVYLLLWLLMPADPFGAPVAAAAGRSGRRARRPHEPRTPVPGLTVAALLIVIGAMALLDRFTWLSIGATTFLGAALLVVAAGLTAAAFIQGRSARGGLIALGVVLSFALVGSTGNWDHKSEGFGDRVYRPATLAEVRDVYRGGVGDLTLDLTRLDVSDLNEPITTEIQHDVGDVRVVLPSPSDAQVKAHTDLGSVDVLGEGSDNGFFSGHGVGSWVDDGDAEFDLIITNGLGDVEVSRG
jgi:phage shock protein PspC (stress-responsive transcriptional regulator)/predicted membrane protein